MNQAENDKRCEVSHLMEEKEDKLKQQRRRQVLHINKNREMFNKSKKNPELTRWFILHLQSCSPGSVWPASSWEKQEWRGFWRQVKTPVKMTKHQSSWLALLFTSHIFHMEWTVWACGCHDALNDALNAACVLKQIIGLLCRNTLRNLYHSTHSNHKGNGTDHLQNERNA